MESIVKKIYYEFSNSLPINEKVYKCLIGLNKITKKEKCKHIKIDSKDIDKIVFNFGDLYIGNSITTNKILKEIYNIDFIEPYPKIYNKDIEMLNIYGRYIEELDEKDDKRVNVYNPLINKYYVSNNLEILNIYKVFVIDKVFKHIKHFSHSSTYFPNLKFVNDIIFKLNKDNNTYCLNIAVIRNIANIEETILLEYDTNFLPDSCGLDNITYSEFILKKWLQQMK